MEPFLQSTKRNHDVSGMGKFTWNMFHWNKNDIKSSQTTNGDYCDGIQVSRWSLQRCNIAILNLLIISLLWLQLSSALSFWDSNVVLVSKALKYWSLSLTVSEVQATDFFSSSWVFSRNFRMGVVDGSRISWASTTIVSDPDSGASTSAHAPREYLLKSH